jgi:hypothetical protein
MKPIQFLFALLGSVTFGAIFAMSNSAQNTEFPKPEASVTAGAHPSASPIFSPFATAYPSPFATASSPFATAYPSPFATASSPSATAYPSPFATAYPSPFATAYPSPYSKP